MYLMFHNQLYYVGDASKSNWSEFFRLAMTLHKWQQKKSMKNNSLLNEIMEIDGPHTDDAERFYRFCAQSTTITVIIIRSIFTRIIGCLYCIMHTYAD